MGLNSIRLVFSIYELPPFKKNKNIHTRNILQTSTETSLGHYLLKVLMEILKSYLKELRPPKPSADMLSVFLCRNVSCQYVHRQQLFWTLNIATYFPKDVDWLISSSFVFKLTNVYDNTNELSSVQKCAFQIPQGSFCILFPLNFISLVFSCS